MSPLMSLLRRVLKDLLAWSMYRSGLLSWRLRRELCGQCVALMYHRVMPATERRRTFSHDAIIVDPQRFAMHLDTLMRHFDIVSLDTYAAALDTSPATARPRLLITFDDAWADNHQHAYPVLREKRLPATVFVPVDYIETGRLFWQEELGHLLRASCDKAAARPLLQRYGWQRLADLSEPNRSEQIKQAVRAIKHLDNAELETLLAAFRAIADAPERGPDGYLSGEQMRDMAAHDISFQSHACSHRMLPRLNDDEIQAEMRNSFEWLATRFDKAPIAIAYPNGDYDERVLVAARQAGYMLGFSTRAGAIEARHTEPAGNRYALRRVNIHDDSAATPARLLMSVYLACRHGRRH